jgi:hypothetical protein
LSAPLFIATTTRSTRGESWKKVPLSKRTVFSSRLGLHLGQEDGQDGPQGAPLVDGGRRSAPDGNVGESVDDVEELALIVEGRLQVGAGHAQPADPLLHPEISDASGRRAALGDLAQRGHGRWCRAVLAEEPRDHGGGTSPGRAGEGPLAHGFVDAGPGGVERSGFILGGRGEGRNGNDGDGEGDQLSHVRGISSNPECWRGATG